MRASDEDPQRAQRAVQSAEVGGRLLLALGESAGPMALKELAVQAGLVPSRAHPYLVSFCRLGLVEQDPHTNRYALGPAALRIGLTCLYQSDAMKQAGPIAEDLAASTGQAVALAVWGNFGATVVRLIEARQPLHVAMRAGSVMSLFGTATGRAFAGSLPRRHLEEALAGPIGARGADSALSAAERDAEMRLAEQELRARGVVRAVGRPIPGVNAFSAPVRDHEGKVALVITALGHQDQFPSAWTSPLALAVRTAAQEVSNRLGYVAARHLGA
jgi:DNA-binding IclR family transcriptional regulator